MTDEPKRQAEELAEAYATNEKLPTKCEWIATRGGEHGQYLSYEVRWFVVDAFLAGFEACHERMSERLRVYEDALKNIAEHKQTNLDKVYLILQCEGYQKCAKEALSRGRGRGGEGRSQSE